MSKKRKNTKPLGPELFSFDITFRDEPHFNKVVKELNKSAGRGREHWTITGHVRKHVIRGTAVTRKVSIFTPRFDKEIAMFLALL